MVYLQRWHGWCHMKLQPSRRKSCVHHTAMLHVTSCKATWWWWRTMNHFMWSPVHTTVAAFEYDIKTEHTLMYQFVYMYELDFTLFLKHAKGERNLYSVQNPSKGESHRYACKHRHSHAHTQTHAHACTQTQGHMHGWASACMHTRFRKSLCWGGKIGKYS